MKRTAERTGGGIEASGGGRFGDRLALHRAFWAGEPMERPLLAVNVGLFGNDRCKATMRALPAGVLRPEDVPVEPFLEDCRRYVDLHEQVDDDFPFVASPFVYVPWMEAIMGCPVVASPQSIWAEPCLDSPLGWKPGAPPLESPWTRKLMEILRALVSEFGDRHPVSITMMRGPSDIMAAMLGAANLPLALLDEPERAAAIAQACGDAFIAVGRSQQALLPDSADGYMDGDRGFRVWAPQRFIWLQADALALLSPALYEEFFLPVDRAIVSSFPALAYHLHPSALWAAPVIAREQGVGAVEMGFEESVPDIEGTFAACRAIREHKPLVVWRQYDERFPAWLDRALRELAPGSGPGLSIQITVADRAQADRATAEFRSRVEG